MKAIKEIEGVEDKDLKEYANPDFLKFAAMVEKIREKMNVTTLKFQRLDDLVEAIGLPMKNFAPIAGMGAVIFKKWLF